MEEQQFHLQAPFQPTGDQPQAIEALVQGIAEGDSAQTLLGVTGSGKTFTMANIIARCNRPTLILEPNKTLASQICTEMRSFFPDDAFCNRHPEAAPHIHGLVILRDVNMPPDELGGFHNAHARSLPYNSWCSCSTAASIS